MITTILANQYVDSAMRPVKKHDLETCAIQRKRCPFDFSKNKSFYAPSKAHLSNYNKKSGKRGIIGAISATDQWNCNTCRCWDESICRDASQRRITLSNWPTSAQQLWLSTLGGQRKSEVLGPAAQHIQPQSVT